MALPFKVAPSRQYEIIDVGNEEIGILPIKKYENLTRAEFGFIKNHHLYNYQFALAALAKRISQATGAHFAYVNDRINAYMFGGFIQNDLVTVEGKEGRITKIETVEGIELITVSFDDSDSDFVSVAGEGVELVTPAWYADYYSEITALTNDYLESLPMQNYVYATAIIIFRLDPSWTLEDTMNPELLNYELVREVAAFAYKEKNGWNTAEPTKEASTDEELGKSLKETPNPTGKASSGESSTTGDTTSDSITETSPSSPSA